MQPITLLICLVVTAFAGLVPAPVAYRNLTLLDGTIKAVELPPGIQFVSTADATARTSLSGHEKRLTWHPGNENAECSGDEYYLDKTSNGSPSVADCKWIADVESQPDNQVSEQARHCQVAKLGGKLTNIILLRATSWPSPSQTTKTTATGAA